MNRADHSAQAMRPDGGRYAPVLVRGYVVAVYAPGEGPKVPDKLPGWLADVEVIEPGWRGLLRWVPVMTDSGGVYDIEHWQPRPMAKKLSGGTFTLEGGPSATQPSDADGDLVIVAFLGGDVNRPVIVGQLPHPQTETPAEKGYRLLRTIAGVRIGVTEDGSIEAQVPKGQKLTVTMKDGDGATIEATDDAVTVTKAKLTVRSSATSTGIQAVLLEAVLADIASVLVEWYPLIQTLAAIFGVALPNSATNIPLLVAGTVNASGKPYKAASTESD